MIKLTVVAGPDTGSVFTPEGDAIVIGRGRDCNVVLHDGAMSRRHCAIQREGGRVVLADLGSTSGTFLNDMKTRIDTHPLRTGDEIILGKSHIRVELLQEKGGTVKQSSGPIVLTVVSGPDQGMIFSPTQEAFSIGRADTCDITLHDSEASRLHVTIKREAGGYRLYDEHSRNGTFLRTPTARISQADLADGDIIYLGQTQLRVEIALGKPASAETGSEAVVAEKEKGAELSPASVSPPSERPELRIMLRVIEGKDVGAVFEPRPGTRRFTVGRGEAADFRLQDQQVSRIHFAVEATPSGFVLTDAGSLNGTFLDQNTERVSRVELKGGEEIRVCDTRLQVEIIRPEEATMFAPPQSPQTPAVVEQPPPAQDITIALLAVSDTWSPCAALLLMLVAIMTCSGFILLGKPSLFSSGPVSASHARWEGACATCHPPWGAQPVNATCVTADCHASALQNKENVRDNCVGCHTEHRGRSFALRGDKVQCWSCHESGFQKRVMETSYGKAFANAGEKRGLLLHAPLPATEEERRAWQQNVPHVESGLIFSHTAHAKDSQLDACEACHQPLPGEVINALGVVSAFPTHTECIGCHKGVADSDPSIARASASRACLQCHTRQNGAITHVQRSLSYVQFSHDDHKKTECVTCHFVVKNERGYGPVLRSAAPYPLPMQACYFCHEQEQATTSCVDCHRAHHSFSPGIQITGGWLSRLTLSHVLLALLVMVVGACVHTYTQSRLER